MLYDVCSLLTAPSPGIEVAKIPSLQEQPVQSAITVPPPGQLVPLDEALSVAGYAYSGGGRGEPLSPCIPLHCTAMMRPYVYVCVFMSVYLRVRQALYAWI